MQFGPMGSSAVPGGRAPVVAAPCYERCDARTRTSQLDVRDAALSAGTLHTRARACGEELHR